MPSDQCLWFDDTDLKTRLSPAASVNRMGRIRRSWWKANCFRRNSFSASRTERDRTEERRSVPSSKQMLKFARRGDKKTSLQSVIGGASPRRRHFYPEALITRPLSFMVFLFEQTAQASTCQTVRGFGVTQVRYHSKDWR